MARRPLATLRTRTAALLGTCVGWTACAAPARVPPSEAARVERRTVEDVFLLTGELTAVRSVELTVPQVEGGRVQVKWLIEDGSEVEAGDVVAELDNSQIAQGLEDRRLRLAEARIALEERRASLDADAAQKRFEEVQARTAWEKAGIEAAVPVELRSRKEWHEKQQALRKAESDLEKARLALRAFDETSAAEVEGLGLAEEKARRDVTRAEQSLGELSLRAPKGGIVILGGAANEDRPVQVGDNLWPGWRVASIPDLEAMEVTAFLHEVDDGRIAPGQAARVVLDSDLDRAHAARVTEVGVVAEEARYAGGFRVRLALERTVPDVMRPGLSARVEVVRRVYEDALVVPRAAILRGDGAPKVRRASGALSEIRLAACLPLDCVVESGLAEGDRVAIP